VHVCFGFGDGFGFGFGCGIGFGFGFGFGIVLVFCFDCSLSLARCGAEPRHAQLQLNEEVRRGSRARWNALYLFQFNSICLFVC
jgi:hypothetical protein